MDRLLQVRNLSAIYRSDGAPSHRAVDGVSFDISAGEIVGIMGESGCGKTTLALALLGLHDKGRVEMSGMAMLGGTDLLALSERELQSFRGEKISLVSQEPGIALCPVRRVGEQIAEVLHAHSDQSWKQCRAEADVWLERVGLQPVKRIRSAYPHQLSGGQLQRIVLSQALICKPQLLIADEPTASLDARAQAEFIELLRMLKRDCAISVLLISHTPEMQASLADRVLVMKAGRIAEQGTFAEIFQDPKDPYTRTMISRETGIKGASSGANRSEEVAAQ